MNERQTPDEMRDGVHWAAIQAYIDKRIDERLKTRAGNFAPTAVHEALATLVGEVNEVAAMLCESEHPRDRISAERLTKSVAKAMRIAV